MRSRTAAAAGGRRNRFPFSNLARNGVYGAPQPDQTWLAANTGNPNHATIQTNVGNVGKAYWHGPDVNGASYVGSLASAAKSAGKLFVFVPYALPSRDSSGNIPDAATYATYSQNLAAAIGDAPAAIIIEPDSILLWPSGSTEITEQRTSLQAACDAYAACPNARIYLDGTDARWTTPSAVATIVNSILTGNRVCHGLAYNVSNYNTIEQVDSYHAQVVSSLDRKDLRYIIDTSRNGNGPNAAGDWCNPAGRALGKMTLEPTVGGAEAWLWVKTPGTSDGFCGAYPSVESGVFTETIAMDLINNMAGGVSGVTFDAVGPSAAGATATATTTTSWSHTCSGSNRVLIVGVAVGENVGTITSSVTYNGFAMTSVSKVHSNNTPGAGYVEMFWLAAPTTGTHTVTVTASATVDAISAGSVSLDGAHQSTPVGTPATAFGVSTAPSVTVTGTTSGNMVIDAVCCGEVLSASTQTNRWRRNTNTNTGAGNGAGSTAAAGGSVTMTHTAASSEWWASTAVEVLPA